MSSLLLTSFKLLKNLLNMLVIKGCMYVYLMVIVKSFKITIFWRSYLQDCKQD